jgi:membrane protein required for colicin V production
MNILDIIILICFVPSLVQGLRKGFIAQVIAIVSILAGVYLSFRFSSAASMWLSQYIEGSEQVLKIVAFALILVGVAAAFTLLGKLIEGIFKIVMLGWLNKLLGAVFSLLKCALITGLLIMVFNSINNTFGLVAEEELAKSVLYPPLKDIAYTVFPYLKEMLFWN